MKSTGAMSAHLARAHVRLVDDAAHAAPVVAVGVRVDHRRDRQALADMLLEQLPGGAHRLGADQRVEDDPAGLAAHEGDVGQVEAAHLVDAGDHLVEPVVVVEPGLTEQRGVDAVELVLLVEELEPLHVPGDMAGIGHDLQLLGIGAISPCFCSSKSRVSAKGRAAFAFFNASSVNFDGALPLGWKWPASGGAD